MHLPHHVVSSGGMYCGQCELIVKFNKQELPDFVTENLPILNPYLPQKLACVAPQSPRGFSALARLYYLARPNKTAMLRRLPKNPKICDPILLNLLKMRPHYSYSSRENATPSSGTSLLASCKGVPPPGSCSCFASGRLGYTWNCTKN